MLYTAHPWRATQSKPTLADQSVGDSSKPHPKVYKRGKSELHVRWLQEHTKELPQ